MIDLNAKFFGFSLLTWIILAVLVLVLSCTMWKKVSKPSQAKILETEVVQKQEVVSSEGSDAKVIVFYAKWCGFSKKFMGNDFKGGEWKKVSDYAKSKGLSVVEYTDNDEEITKKYKVDGFPTVVFEHGNNVKKMPGYRPAEGLIKELEEFLG